MSAKVSMSVKEARALVHLASFRTRNLHIGYANEKLAEHVLVSAGFGRVRIMHTNSIWFVEHDVYGYDGDYGFACVHARVLRNMCDGRKPSAEITLDLGIHDDPSINSRHYERFCIDDFLDVIFGNKKAKPEPGLWSVNPMMCERVIGYMASMCGVCDIHIRSNDAPLAVSAQAGAYRAFVMPVRR